MPRVAKVLWPLLVITAAAVGYEIVRRLREAEQDLDDMDEMPVDDTLDQSFPASDPPSWSSASAAPATRQRPRGDLGSR